MPVTITSTWAGDVSYLAGVCLDLVLLENKYTCTYFVMKRWNIIFWFVGKKNDFSDHVHQHRRCLEALMCNIDMIFFHHILISHQHNSCQLLFDWNLVWLCHFLVNADALISFRLVMCLLCCWDTCFFLIAVKVLQARTWWRSGDTLRLCVCHQWVLMSL